MDAVLMNSIIFYDIQLYAEYYYVDINMLYILVKRSQCVSVDCLI